MNTEEKLLSDYTDKEKGAYLTAMASIATADRTASAEDLQFLEALADTADLSTEQQEKVRQAAIQLSAGDLKESLDELKSSELRFSLVTDLVAFSRSDENYSEEEQHHVEKIARYLNINEEQYQTINQFVQKASTAENASDGQQQPQNFLESLGMDNQLKAAGINGKSLGSGLLGMLGPIILSSIVSRALGGRQGGGLGGMLGGMLGGGGLGGMLGGNGGNAGNAGRPGGLGSLISMLNGGRGMGSAGGLLNKVLKGF